MVGLKGWGSKGKADPATHSVPAPYATVPPALCWAEPAGCAASSLASLTVATAVLQARRRKPVLMQHAWQSAGWARQAKSRQAPLLLLPTCL